MTALERMRAWIGTYTGADLLSAFQVDFTDQIETEDGSVFPPGLVEVERKRDVLGHTTVTDQYHFGIYRALEPGDAVEVDWLPDFCSWVQAQSAAGLAPVFGDAPSREIIKTEHAGRYGAKDGTELFMIRLSVQFNKYL